MACDNKIINIRIAERYFENLQIFENQYTLKKSMSQEKFKSEVGKYFHWMKILKSTRQSGILLKRCLRRKAEHHILQFELKTKVLNKQSSPWKKKTVDMRAN